LDSKICTGCGQEKPVAEFKPPKPQCTECQRQYRAEWLNRPGARDRQRWHRFRALLAQYGLQPVDYMRLLDAQNGVCAICKCLCKTGRSLAVDHCHMTGVTRALLCVRCNLLVGDYETERRAMSTKNAAAVEKYLAKYGAGNPKLAEGVGCGPLPTRRRTKAERAEKPKNPYRYAKKLTAEQVLEVRQRVAAGESRKAVARELGVASSTVSRVVSGQAWTAVP